jgi:hypothetical protein
LNWLRIHEVDAVIRPWVVRRECLDRMGALDEAFVPTGWDEADLAFRIRQAGWRVATHGYERDRAYHHLGSSTFAKFALNLDQDFRACCLPAVARDDEEGIRRQRKTWWRHMALLPGGRRLRMSPGRPRRASPVMDRCCPDVGTALADRMGRDGVLVRPSSPPRAMAAGGMRRRGLP